MENENTLISEIKQLTQIKEENKINRIFLFISELKEWNNKFNLTSITENRQIIIRHIIDSLEILKCGILQQGNEIIDLGTGAGLPGIPLSIMEPEIKVSLVESNNKKVLLLKHIKEKLDLKNISIVNARAEIISADKKYRERFYSACARALAPFPVALESGIALVKSDGYMFFYMSKKQKDDMKENMNTMEALGCQIHQIHDYSLPLSMGDYSIVIVKKMWKTDKKYPRQYSKIRKNPL